MSALRRILRHTGFGQCPCAICREPVRLETSKTDEDGHAVHEECYLAKIGGKIPPKPIRKAAGR